ncbi:MAG: hypothetical protein ABIY70_10055 [Capsulimonas sp.]|uniref:hypothetical protein n=1 Tax=Capsulimonas sp. TaxID=2494211 RepID=UPI003267678A
MENKAGTWRLAWLVLGLLYFIFGFTYSVIQPLGAAPDEPAHMQYIKFLVNEHRLPVWTPPQYAEGGYETQHPLFAYAVESMPYALTGSLPENMRWQISRWFVLALAGTLLWMFARRLAKRLFPDEPLGEMSLVASICFVPLTFMYLGHLNPDIWVLTISCAGFYLASRLYADADPPNWLPWAAGALAGIAALTKLNILPIVLVLLAAQWLRPGAPRAERLRGVGIIAGLDLVIGGWWYVRNAILYHSPLIHTATHMGTGLELAQRAGAHGGPPQGVFRTALWTLQNTYISTWFQPEWLPYGWALAFLAVSAILIVLAIVGYARRGQKPSASEAEDADETSAPTNGLRFLAWAAVLTIAFVLIGQQSAFWTVDVELNMGGRYMLAALPAIAIAINLGVARMGGAVRKSAWGAWIATLIVANFLAIQQVVFVLTPQFHPGWKMFDLLG